MAVVLFLSLFRIWLLLLVLDFFFGGGGFVDCVFWEWATVYALNSWVSWVNFCWVVVPIWVRGGSWWFRSRFGLWLVSWFGSSFVVWFVIYWWVWSL